MDRSALRSGLEPRIVWVASEAIAPPLRWQWLAGSCYQLNPWFQAVSVNNSRPISMRRISLVPAPISYSLASRSSRPVG